MKIAILGYSGSGKSTLAKHISNHFAIPLLYLDTVNFESNWAKRNDNEALEIVSKFMCNEDWVIDGNYKNFFQNERLMLAYLIVCMKFSTGNCLLRAYQRYRKNKNTYRESVSNGCNEKMDLEFIWWILFGGRTRMQKRHYAEILGMYRKKTVVLKNQKELNQFMFDLDDIFLC